MTYRYYKSNSIEAKLNQTLPDSAGGAYSGQVVTLLITNVPGTSATSFNFPSSVPFTLIIDPDQTNEEVVEVTYINTENSSYQIKRGVDGSPVSSHTADARVRHGVSARDFQDSRDHEAATSGVHGVTGSLASLNNPTFTGTVTIPTLSLTGNVSTNGTTVTPVQVSYLNGATSNIQSQINAKAPVSTPTFTTSATAPIFNATSKFQINGTDVTGLTGSWTFFTPTIGNWGVGNGTFSSYYTQIGKTIIWQMRFTLGSTTTKSGSPTFSLPVAAARAGNYISCGQAMYYSGATPYAGSAWLSSTTTLSLSCSNAAGTYLTYSTISPTVPETWTTNDSINFIVVYEAA